MKISYLLSLMICATVVFAEIQPVAPEGSGTKDDPYLFDRLENFFWLSQTPWTKKIYCKQTADIDASITQNEGETSWPLISNYDEYELNYDGQGYSIISPYLSDSVTNTRGIFSFGIFQIKNLNIKKAKANYEREFGSILVGEMHINQKNKSTLLSVENCNIEGEILTKSSASGLINSVDIADKTASLIVSNCFCDVIVQGEEIGASGLISNINSFYGNSINLYSSGSKLTVRCKVINGMGGLVGSVFLYSPTNYVTTATIADCCSKIDLVGTKGGGKNCSIGGLFAKVVISIYKSAGMDIEPVCVANIFRCRSTGSITLGKNDIDGYLRTFDGGGFIGELGCHVEGASSTIFIDDCYSDVAFDLDDDYGNPAGFIGTVTESNKGIFSLIAIARCYASTPINIVSPRSDFWEYKKPFVGNYNHAVAGTIQCLTITNSYSNQDFFKFDDEYAIGKTGKELKQKKTFKDWDFVNVWDIDEGESFPYLINEVPEPLSVGAFGLAFLIALRLILVLDKK